MNHLLNKVLAEWRVGGGTSGGTGGSYTLLNPLGVENIADIIKKVAYYLSVYIAPPIVTIMILIAGFYFLTAGDKPERLITARQIILWTVVGYVIILISWGATSIIAEILGGAATTPIPPTTPVPPYLENYPYSLPS